ncbi:ABC transporter permease [Halobacteria archaeon AArc-curdl1]|uniref:ABC transporter permease n=1 Tax=Natronosalvus hydrolyticus TaxID=2979988 RepID=A0AAP3E5Z0_9EURY|nr:ABC transporter permease [Halobacteria archaeon AArc-curdl1]
MKWYIFKRLLWAGVATMVVLTITFVLMYLTPDTRIMELEFQAAQSGTDPEQARQAAETARGMDQAFHIQYIDFMQNMLSFNWGWSDSRSEPVIDALASAIPYSMMYGVPAVIISTIIGIVIGLYSAVNQYTRGDYVATFVAFFGISIPNFWFAIILLVIFGTWLGWVDLLFDTQASKIDGEWALRAIVSWENVKQLILPMFVLMTASVASMMRYTRAEALEYVESDFIKTAKAKGVSERTIVAKHIFRPASIPIATILVGDILGIVFVGSYLIEVVFGIPGLGYLSFDAIMSQDTALVFGTVFVPVFVAIIGNLAQDIAYVILDPRIKYGDR